MIFDEDSTLSCSICSEKYCDDRKPIVGKCGHSLCNLCAEKIQRNINQICPFCKMIKSFENQTVNYDLMTKIEHLSKKFEIEKENQKIREKCATHNQNNAYSFCYDDSIFLCSECIPDHIDSHSVKMFKESSVLLLNKYHKAAINIRDDLRNSITVQKDSFLYIFNKLPARSIPEQ